jgi:ribosomal protein S12 methylthiotransferase accessory factor YcaO
MSEMEARLSGLMEIAERRQAHSRARRARRGTW